METPWVSYCVMLGKTIEFALYSGLPLFISTIFGTNIQSVQIGSMRDRTPHYTCIRSIQIVGVGVFFGGSPSGIHHPLGSTRDGTPHT